MKFKLLTIIALSLVLFSSCTKEEIDPVLEISITTKASTKWAQSDIRVGNVRFAIENEDGTPAWGNLQNYTGVDFETSLSEQDNNLIFNDRHFDMHKVTGLKLLTSKIHVTNGDEGIRSVEIPWHEQTPLSQDVSIENGKSYRIEFILDLDQLIYEENGQLFLDNNYDIEISEL